MGARVGQVSNGLCCLATGFTCAAVFANELDAKDIVFDSLALLFIFTIDDLTSDALAGFNITDEDFQAQYTWLVSLLGACPVEIKDVVNRNAKCASDIFRFRLSS